MAVNSIWPESLLGVGQWYEIIGKGRFGPIEEGGSALNARTRRLDFVCIVDDSSDNCVCARACVLCLGE